MTRSSKGTVRDFVEGIGANREREGFAPDDIAARVVPGAVFDADPDAVLLHGRPREPRAGRVVIVLDADDFGLDLRPSAVVIVPCTASHHGRVPPSEAEMPGDEAAFDRDRVIALSSLAQVIPQLALRRFRGALRVETLADVVARVDGDRLRRRVEQSGKRPRRRTR